MKVIAEIGTSHNGSLEKAEKLIDTSIESGADFVKFQWVYASEILHPDTGFVNLPGGKTRLYDRFKALEMDKSFYKDCLDYVHSKGALFMCSPFGLKSLEELAEITPDAIKIASPELNHIPLLKLLSEYRKDKKIKVILSSGVSKLKDIERALEIIGTENVTLLHCITFYPAPEEEYNLRLIPNLSKIFGLETGVSDHSLDPVLVPSLACALGGTMIEKHITLSRKTSGLDDPVALEGEQFAFMSHCIRQCEAVLRQYGKEKGFEYIINQLKNEGGYGDRVEKCLGTGIKKLAKAEEENYGRTNRSLHFMHGMKKGDKITEDDIAVLRTEKELTPGLHPDFLEKLINRTLSKDVTAGEGVLLEHLLS